MRSSAGATGSFHFDDKMQLNASSRMLGYFCEITYYLNVIEELEEFIADSLGQEEVNKMLEEEEEE